MMELAGKAIAKAVGFKKQYSYSQALKILTDFYSEHFDLMHIENETNSIKIDLYRNLLEIEADIYIRRKAIFLLFKALDILG
jgi:hypothetical protein